MDNSFFGFVSWRPVQATHVGAMDIVDAAAGSVDFDDDKTHDVDEAGKEDESSRQLT